jgi:DNA-binding IclR family transcriptional regulator
MLETGDAVSQAQVARRSGLEKMTVSRAMRALERVGWVDRGPDMAGPAWRVWVLEGGERVARQAALRVEAVSARVRAA